MSREERAAADVLRTYAAQYVTRWEPRLSPACWYWPLPARPVALTDWQAGRCAVCGTTADDVAPASFALVVDHDHGTGLVRGLLCRSCNKTEAHQDVTDGRFLNYRARPAAALLGLRIPYCNA